MGDRLANLAAKVRRDELAAAGSCINGRRHQKPAKGRRCDWCVLVHRVGLATAVRLADTDPMATRPPPGYVYRGPR